MLNWFWGLDDTTTMMSIIMHRSLSHLSDPISKKRQDVVKALGGVHRGREHCKHAFPTQDAAGNPCLTCELYRLQSAAHEQTE